MTRFQLLQWKGAIKLEAAGMKHSSGRSVKAHAARELGMPVRSTHKQVIAKIIALLAFTSTGGCATCNEHPVMCGVAGGIAVALVVGSIPHHDSVHNSRRVIIAPDCTKNPSSCQ